MDLEQHKEITACEFRYALYHCLQFAPLQMKQMGSGTEPKMFVVKGKKLKIVRWNLCAMAANKCRLLSLFYLLPSFTKYFFYSRNRELSRARWVVSLSAFICFERCQEWFYKNHEIGQTSIQSIDQNFESEKKNVFLGIDKEILPLWVGSLLFISCVQWSQTFQHSWCEWNLTNVQWIFHNKNKRNQP